MLTAATERVKYSVKVADLTHGPFSDTDVDEVHLVDAPLIRVLMQIQFPAPLALLSAGASDEVDKVTVGLGRAGYPFVQENHELQIELTASGVTQSQGTKVWQFHSGDRAWHVTLSPQFVSLHTSAYAGRSDFVARARAVVECVAEALGTGVVVSRIGYRYINRLVGEDVAAVRDLVQRELLGVLAVDEGEARLESGLSEVTYSFGGPNQSLGMTDGLQVRWGRLPRGTTLDPSIEASDEKSWVLDLDAFQVKQVELTGDMVETALNALAHRALRFFRWAVTPEFDKRFGAEQ